MKVRELMQRRVTTIAPDDTLHVADGIMSMGRLRHLPVVSGGALVGILTHRDILRAPSTFVGFATDARAVLKELRARDAMRREVVTIGAEATVQQAAELLLAHKVGCLPVLEGGALVGIVTTSDLLYAIVGPHELADDGPGSMVAVSASSSPGYSARLAGKEQ